MYVILRPENTDNTTKNYIARCSFGPTFLGKTRMRYKHAYTYFLPEFDGD